MGGKGDGDGSKLRREGEPSHSAVRKEDMAARTCWGEAMVSRRGRRRGMEADRKIGEERMSGVEPSERESFRDESGSMGSGRRGRDDSGRRDMGDTFQWIVGVKHCWGVCSGPSIAVGEIQLQSNTEVLSYEGIIVMAS